MTSPAQLEDRKKNIFCAPEFGGICVPVPIFVHPRDICNVGLIRQGGGLVVDTPITASICILLRNETDLTPYLTKDDDEDKILDLPSPTSTNRVVLSSAWIWHSLSQGERVNHHPYIIRSRHAPLPLPSPSTSTSTSVIGSTPASSVTHGETAHAGPLRINMTIKRINMTIKRSQEPLQYWRVRSETSEPLKASGSKRAIPQDIYSDDDEEDEDVNEMEGDRSVDFVITKIGTKKGRPCEHIPKDRRVEQMCDLLQEWDQNKSLDSFLKDCSGRWGLRHWNSFWPMNKPAIVEHLRTRGIEMVRTEDKPPRWSKRRLEKD